MRSINFFKKKVFKINKLFPKFGIKNTFTVKDIKPLDTSQNYDLTFFDNIKYKNHASKTKASACITKKNLVEFLPKKTEKIIVDNVLLELAKVLKLVYPLADVDYPDLTVKKPNIKKYLGVKFSNNVLIGKNVKIGKNSYIGANTIIEHDVIIGSNCVIGSNSVIKNSVIGNNVIIQDSNKIGQKGFGFIPQKKVNIKFPHIGKVVIDDDVEIASGCTIDRGSIGDTIIGKNTYLDNQVHIAHNVKIGSNCMIAGQVGFAGSSTIGNNVSIGGQAGVSGHLIIGNNVKIGGGSGVVKDVSDNAVIMGYPAVPFREFLKKKWAKKK